MADKLEFSNFDEIENRASFSSEHEISTENFGSLVGRYHLLDKVICQVRTVRGKCHKKHNYGYVGVNQAGKEVLIGGHCAQKYFYGDKNFSIEKKRIDAQIDRNNALEKLNYYRSNLLRISGELILLKKKAVEVRKIMDTVYKGFPNNILIFLRDAQRTHNWEIKVDVLRPSKGYETRSQKWAIDSLCISKSISPPQDVIRIIYRVTELIDILNYISLSELTSLSSPKLIKISKSLSEIDNIEKDIDDYYYETKKFIEPSNLDYLLYLCDDSEEKTMLVRTIFSVSGAKVSSDAYVNLRIRRIIERVEKEFDGYRVRKNQLVFKYKKNSI